MLKGFKTGVKPDLSHPAGVSQTNKTRATAHCISLFIENFSSLIVSEPSERGVAPLKGHPELCLHAAVKHVIVRNSLRSDRRRPLAEGFSPPSDKNRWRKAAF